MEPKGRSLDHWRYVLKRDSCNSVLFLFLALPDQEVSGLILPGTSHCLSIQVALELTNHGLELQLYKPIYFYSACRLIILAIFYFSIGMY